MGNISNCFKVKFSMRNELYACDLFQPNMAHFLPTSWTIATSGVICGSERSKSKFDGHKMRAVYIGHSARKTPPDSLC